jgi:mono/diheme cytochrome c family protein
LRTEIIAATVFALLITATGCRQDMQDQPKYIPLRPTDFFDDHRSARPLPENTVARGHLNADTELHTGMQGDKPVERFPFPITRDVLARGQQRYDIYCAPCHDRLGDGDGMVVRRGYRKPPSYHIDRLRQVADGYLYDVITNGFGAMPDYAAQIQPRDRWAIVAYVRALQLSHQGTMNDVPADKRGELESGGAR